jgi:CRP-like cAMP-binding protein
MGALSRQAKRDVLATIDLFSTLPRTDLDELAALTTERRAARDALVVRRGDTDASLLVLVHGRMRVSAMSNDGREVTLRIMEAGTFLGEIALLDGRERSADVIAMIDSLVLVIERAAFLPFLSARPDLMLRMMEILCDRLRRSSVAFEDVALSPLSSRLARLLLDLAALHGRPVEGGVRIRIKLSQKELSAQVAATRERVNKQLRQWHEQGVLGEFDGDMVVRQPEALKALIA